MMESPARCYTCGKAARMVCQSCNDMAFCSLDCSDEVAHYHAIACVGSDMAPAHIGFVIGRRTTKVNRATAEAALEAMRAQLPVLQSGNPSAVKGSARRFLFEGKGYKEKDMKQRAIDLKAAIEKLEVALDSAPSKGLRSKLFKTYEVPTWAARLVAGK